MTDTTPFAESGPGTDVNADAQSALFDAPTPTPAATDESGSSDAMTISSSSSSSADSVTAADMAAEMDTSVPADAAVVPDPAVVDDPDITGICRGGPYDGRRVTCRFPGGFVLYQKPRRLMWTYATDASRPGDFLVRSNGAPANVTDVDKLREAAEGVQLDVIAYDDGPAVA
jgi:hypothetical protein